MAAANLKKQKNDDLTNFGSQIFHQNQTTPGLYSLHEQIKEEIYSKIPTFGPKLDTMVMFDADHAHNQCTHHSISGLITFVASTPVTWTS